MLDKLCKVVPKVLCDYRADCCILASRVALDVLRYFKIPAKALTVKTLIYNRPLWKRITEGRTPQNNKELEKAGEEDGSYSVGLGYGHTIGKWSGHLVVTAEGQMLDLTIGQASRPQQGIFLEPFFFPTNADFLAGEKPMILTCDDVVVKYTSFPHDLSYQKAPDWKNFGWREKLVGQIIRCI